MLDPQITEETIKWKKTKKHSHNKQIVSASIKGSARCARHNSSELLSKSGLLAAEIPSHQHQRVSRLPSAGESLKPETTQTHTTAHDPEGQNSLHRAVKETRLWCSVWFCAGIWLGIELDKPNGKNDGSVGGVRYFSCPPKHGVFAPPSHVQR